MTDTTEAKLVRQPRRMAREHEPQIEPEQVGAMVDEPTTAKPDKPQSKSTLVLMMLQRPDGATLDELVAATGWLPHTARAALTGLRKKGHAVTSDKVDAVRRYCIEGAAA